MNTILNTSKQMLTSLLAVLCFFVAGSAQASQTLEVVTSLQNGSERVSCILISPADNFVRVAMADGSCNVAGRILESAPGILISPADNRMGDMFPGILISPADNRMGDMFPGILISPADNKSCSKGVVVSTNGILISPADNFCPTHGILISPADNAVEIYESAE